MRLLREAQQLYRIHFHCALGSHLAVADQELPIPLFQQQHGARFHYAFHSQNVLVGCEHLDPLPQ